MTIHACTIFTCCPLWRRDRLFSLWPSGYEYWLVLAFFVDACM